MAARVRIASGKVFGPIISANEAATLMGVSRATVYALMDRDEFPTKLIDLGGPRPRVLVVPLLEYLGITHEELPPE